MGAGISFVGAQRRSQTNHRAAIRPRRDRETPADVFHPATHVPQTISGLGQRRVHTGHAAAVVFDFQCEGRTLQAEPQPDCRGVGVPNDVGHRFLGGKENVVAHAHASAVWLRLRLERGTFTLEIEDNGRGMAGLDAPMAQTRNGLRNMRRRMEDIRGEFAIVPGPDGGTVVRLTAPFGTDKTDARAQAQSDSRR